MKIKISEFKRLIREVSEEIKKPARPPEENDTLEIDSAQFSPKDIWNGFAEEIKKTDYQGAINQVLDNLAKDQKYYKLTKGSFSA